ncbi:MAG TPA: hypothetical protein VHX52_04435 [Steroidobacteraceae bacterium]|jgi:hypothetical protein|nr:hypothetical protein [Steroidobacteraceae bacterium]
MNIRRAALSSSMGLMAILYSLGAAAQVDLSGNWALQNFQHALEAVNGPFPNFFAGVPLNKEGISAASTYSGDEREELNRQCAPWLVQYIVEGPFGVQIQPVKDPVNDNVIGWYMTGALDRAPLTIWMDGRKPPPPDALHTFSGFATGVWRGPTLVTHVINIKDGRLTRNGAPMSNQATFDMFITRHDDELTITGIVRDPVYLGAPYPLAQVFRLGSASIDDGAALQIRCSPAEVISGLSDGYHASQFLPGQSSTLNFALKKWNIPLKAAEGGTQTMYPEFQMHLRGYGAPPGYCQMLCCAPGTGPGLGFVCPAPPQPGSPPAGGGPDRPGRPRDRAK